MIRVMENVQGSPRDGAQGPQRDPLKNSALGKMSSP